jgi:hypothetical protein
MREARKRSDSFGREKSSNFEREAENMSSLIPLHDYNELESEVRSG